MDDATEIWLVDNLKVAFSQGSNDPCEIFARPEGIRLLKATGEIAYFLTYGALEVSEDFISSILAIVEPIITSPSFFSLMRFNPDYATLFLSLLDVGHHFQLIDRRDVDDISKILRWFAACGPERVPYRQIDQLYGLKNLGHAAEDRDLDRIAQFGCLRDEDRILNIQQHDAYALTHTIFYLTDFGRLPSPLDARLSASIAHTLTRLSYVSISENDMDLLAEYVLCAIYCKWMNAEFAGFVEILKSQRQNGGYWKGPFSIDASLKRDSIPEGLHPFYSHYHTTILAWQAGKYDRDLQRHNKPRAVAAYAWNLPVTNYWSSVCDDISAVLDAGDRSSDVMLVAWVANRLGMGFEGIFSSLRDIVGCLERSIQSVEVDKLRFLCGHGLDAYRNRSPSFDIDTVDDLWIFAFTVSTMAAIDKIRTIRKYLSLAYETNRIAYVRILSVAVGLQLIDGDSLGHEVKYLDSLYSAKGVFLWSPGGIDDGNNYRNASLLGRLILERAFQNAASAVA